jgi:hypothetical protein
MEELSKLHDKESDLLFKNILEKVITERKKSSEGDLKDYIVHCLDGKSLYTQLKVINKLENNPELYHVLFEHKDYVIPSNYSSDSTKSALSVLEHRVSNSYVEMLKRQIHNERLNTSLIKTIIKESTRNSDLITKLINLNSDKEEDYLNYLKDRKDNYEKKIVEFKALLDNKNKNK